MQFGGNIVIFSFTLSLRKLRFQEIQYGLLYMMFSIVLQTQTGIHHKWKFTVSQ